MADVPLLSESALGGVFTPTLEQAIRAATALPAEDQDALAAEMQRPAIHPGSPADSVDPLLRSSHPRSLRTTSSAPRLYTSRSPARSMYRPRPKRCLQCHDCSERVIVPLRPFLTHQLEGGAMDKHGSELPDPESRPREFGSAKELIHMADDFDEPLFCEASLADWNREEEDAAWSHLQQPSEGAVTPTLEQAIRAAKALPAEDQDALAAAMLEWIEDDRRWAESFARTHEALAELAREAVAEHHAGQTLDCEYAEMAEDEAREAEAAEWSEGLVADVADGPDEPRPAADE